MDSPWKRDQQCGRYYRLVKDANKNPYYEWDEPGGPMTEAPQDVAERNQRTMPSSQTYPSDNSRDTQGPSRDSFGCSVQNTPYGPSGRDAYSEISMSDGLRTYRYAYTSPSLSQNARSGFPIQYSEQLVATRPSSQLYDASHAQPNYVISSTQPDSQMGESRLCSPNTVPQNASGRRTVSVALSLERNSDPEPINAAGRQVTFPGSYLCEQRSARTGYEGNNPYGHPSPILEVAPGESLDSRYKVRPDPKKFFKVGRVFAMVWHESFSDSGTQASQRVILARGKFREPIYSSIRRMVVVREQKGCAWCIPISTYSGKGLAKPGVDVSTHAIIHMKGTKPARQAAEPPMTKEPIAVEPASPDQKLDPMSRINFAKIHTIEHNVKVLPVGRVSDESIPKFEAYVRNEFNRQ
ncbi:hypothetical protein VTN00DRAFT_6699 [Thermoascus crustaceus]|uniref:uncharacterized protein n=1 Tax=Thermoascus crustaceus TaxID=5088 RepID=UPI0037427717